MVLGEISFQLLDKDKDALLSFQDMSQLVIKTQDKTLLNRRLEVKKFSLISADHLKDHIYRDRLVFGACAV